MNRIGVMVVAGLFFSLLIATKVSAIIVDQTPEWSHWEFEEEEVDGFLMLNITSLENNTFELENIIKKDLPKNYQWGLTICVNVSEIDLFNLKMTKETAQRGWCSKYAGEGFNIVRYAKNIVAGKIRIKLPLTVKSFEIYGGQGSYNVVATSYDNGIGSGDASFLHHVFFDPVNNRWHVLYIDEGDIVISSASHSNVSNWTVGRTWDTGNWDYEDFDCVLDTRNSTTTFLHCVWADYSTDVMYYERCELTGTDTYISNCGGKETVIDASTMGQSATDDIALPNVAIDENNCVLIAFDFEDDSKSSQDEHRVAFTKEDNDTTCGDGDFDTDDHETGFPDWSVQSEIGYYYPFSAGLETFGDKDAVLHWIDTDTTTSADLEKIYFNGSTNTFGTQKTLDVDIEFSTSWEGYTSVAFGDKTIGFGMDDGTKNYDAYITNTRDGSLSSHIDTNIDPDNSINKPAIATAVVDTVADGGDDIWVFGDQWTDTSDVRYSSSTDGGSSWSVSTLWCDECGTGALLFSSFFSEDNCNIMVRWTTQIDSVINIVIDTIDTGSCPSPPAGDCWREDTANNYIAVPDGCKYPIDFEEIVGR